MKEILIKYQTRVVILFLFTMVFRISAAQNPTSCASVGSRANSNGQSNSCPNVSGTAMASNFAATAYATVPVTSKTGNLQLTYSGANASLTPYAITRVWLTTSGTAIQSVSFGPAGVPAISGGNTQVNYCFYGSNLATVGTLSFELTDPQTGTVFGICSYDASCNSNCAVVANPIVLPVKFLSFSAVVEPGIVRLNWKTAQEQNNAGFMVERSIGDSAYSAIGFVPTKNPGGNSGLPTVYEFVDRNLPSDGKIAYRLDQKDLDGRLEYSDIQSVNFVSTSENIKIYVVGHTIKVSWSRNSYVRSCDVYNFEGRLVLTRQAAGKTALTIGDLSNPGVYIVSLTDGAGRRITTKSIYIN